MENKLKVFKIIHAAMCLGTILAYVILGNFLDFKNLKSPVFDTESIIFLCIPIAAFVLSNFLFRMQLKKIDSNLNFEDKLMLYQSASIIRWAVIEGAAFVILVLRNDLIMLGVILIIYLIWIRPTEEKIKEDLDIRRL